MARRISNYNLGTLHGEGLFQSPVTVLVKFRGKRLGAACSAFTACLEQWEDEFLGKRVRRVFINALLFLRLVFRIYFFSQVPFSS